ncbi:hypothetical protein [Corynebacterium confusum]|uniref:hypothetical protein n=1 Tax=Corynebacterium confusum TaxID=71254 RepID=UPI0025B2A3EB|nr:hypothetical protein [Corynebacterium confusum]WJY88720.1 Alpha-keto-acid decarboxylase [Corynebacterium confusum]
MRTTIGEFLLDGLKAIGITEIISVPGDFKLSFLEQIAASRTGAFLEVRLDPFGPATADFDFGPHEPRNP